MEEKIMENEVNEVENVNEDYELTAYNDDTEDEDCEDEGGASAGVVLLVGGLAIAGAVSIGKAIWKGVGKLREKAAVIKTEKSKKSAEVIDVESDEPETDEETEDTEKKSK
ncbi:MAG: hypothetical protein NC078_08050 [Ruminococcus sp.]|nr:hypothetical protein [Ruminococcus sp.]